MQQLPVHTCIKRIPQVRIMIGCMFDTVSNYLLQEGDIHLDTSAHQELKDAIVDCICYRISYDESLCTGNSTFCELNIRAERELLQLMPVLFAPKTPCKHIPKITTVGELWMWVKWRICQWICHR